jgi:hypothetical protein
LYLWLPPKYSHGNEKILGTPTEEEIAVILELFILLHNGVTIDRVLISNWIY